MAECLTVNQKVVGSNPTARAKIKGRMMEAVITSRETTKGREYIFRWDEKLYVFKTEAEAKVKLMELQNGSLFA